MNEKLQQNIKLEELNTKLEGIKITGRDRRNALELRIHAIENDMLKINVIEDGMIEIYQGFLEERDVLVSRIEDLEETVKEMKGGEE
mgnify:CR=1 FL=1|tara:strand:- start:77 stop:337 length:261 start_codon:yes stop_codon:yes gene_type:complete